MARTTITIDTPIYNKIKDISRQQHKTITRVISDLLGEAIRGHSGSICESSFKWHSKKMNAKIDYLDKDELYRIMDSGE